MSERNKFLEILVERDSRRPIVRVRNDPAARVSPHLMAKIDMIQTGLGELDSKLEKVKSSINNYHFTNIFFVGRESSVRVNWPKITDIRKLDRQIESLARHEFNRANDIEKKIIETHCSTLMDQLKTLIVKYHTVCQAYQEVNDRLTTRIDQIGFSNPSFEFDPDSPCEIKNGCRILYGMCEKDTYEAVRDRANEIASLAESVSELYKLYEWTYKLLEGDGIRQIIFFEIY